MVKTSPSNRGATDSILGRGAKILHALQAKKKKQLLKTHTHTHNIKQKQYCNKFNKDFKNGPHGKKNQLHEFNDPLNNLVHIQPVCIWIIY